MILASDAATSFSLPVIDASRPVELPDTGDIAPELFFRDIGYVTLKLTNGCNLKCSYCNVEPDHPSTPRMSIQTFKRIADLLITNSYQQQLGLEFHGGEPLLMDDAWFEEAVAYAADLAKKHGKQLVHPMQTNGTLLTEERQKKLLGLGIQIGFSLDGPPHINDELRMAGQSAVEPIKRFVAQGISFGMILVLSPANCDRMDEVMDYFQQVGIEDYRVNFLQPQGWGKQHDVLAASQMTAGMIQIFEHMHRTGCSVIEAETEMSVNRLLTGRNPKPELSCWELECQAGRTYVAVNHLGDVHACGTDMSRHRFGNINSNFDAGHLRQTLSDLHRKDAFYTRCFDCNAKRICHFSCPTSDANDKTFREEACQHTKSFFRYLVENQDKAEQIYNTLRRVRRRPLAL